jgi:hypothetical protein
MLCCLKHVVVYDTATGNQDTTACDANEADGCMAVCSLKG